MQRAGYGMMNAYYIMALFGKEISIMSEKSRDSKKRTDEVRVETGSMEDLKQ
jgi:hypothetical protein